MLFRSGPNAKGNFPRLAKLACKTPVFPEWHNKRLMLYIDNLAEFVKQAIERELEGTFYPQNCEVVVLMSILLVLRLIYWKMVIVKFLMV